MTIDGDLRAYVRECADYLISMSNQKLKLYNRDDIESVSLKFNDLNRSLEKAEDLSETLLMLEVQQRVPLSPEGDLRVLLRAARKGIVDARVATSFALESLAAANAEEKSHNSERALQLSAVRFAVSYFDNPEDRRQREVAKQIMLKAGIQEPSKSKLTTLIKTVRKEIST